MQMAHHLLAHEIGTADAGREVEFIARYNPWSLNNAALQNFPHSERPLIDFLVRVTDNHDLFGKTDANGNRISLRLEDVVRDTCQQDFYWDTPDQQLLKLGFSYRVRLEGEGRLVVCLKSRDEATHADALDRLEQQEEIRFDYFLTRVPNNRRMEKILLSFTDMIAYGGFDMDVQAGLKRLHQEFITGQSDPQHWFKAAFRLENANHIIERDLLERSRQDEALAPLLHNKESILKALRYELMRKITPNVPTDLIARCRRDPYCPDEVVDVLSSFNQKRPDLLFSTIIRRVFIMLRFGQTDMEFAFDAGAAYSGKVQEHGNHQRVSRPITSIELEAKDNGASHQPEETQKDLEMVNNYLLRAFRQRGVQIYPGHSKAITGAAALLFSEQLKRLQLIPMRASGLTATALTALVQEPWINGAVHHIPRRLIPPTNSC